MDALQNDALTALQQDFRERIEKAANCPVIEEDQLLPLDLPERVIRIKNKETGAIRRHFFNRVTRADVDAYFSWMTVTTEKAGKSTDFTIDHRTAPLKLYVRMVKRAEGYKQVNGEDLTTAPDWKNLVPKSDVLRVMNTLTNATQTEKDFDAGIDPEAEVISLDCFWTEDSTGMRHYRGLLHRFKPPSLAHWHKFNNTSTKTRALAGSRSQKTEYPKLNRVLIELYDELVVSVGGYSVGAQPVASREQCISEMDCFHKIAAVSAVFDTSSANEEEETENS
jgi:hypothetical protein